MRELYLRMSMSVDGFVAALDGGKRWMLHGGDPISKAAGVERVSNASLHIMGSHTFNEMATWWPTSTDSFAPPMNEIPKAVFSRQGPGLLQKVSSVEPRDTRDTMPERVLQFGAESWAHAYVASGDLASEITKLKSADGKPILAHGGVSFARSLLATGLVDQILLAVRPVALGKGAALFSGIASPMPLSLVSSTSYPGGVVVQIYRIA